MTPKAIRFVSRALLVAGVMLAPLAARAATPGVGHGTMMIGADRLFGLSVARTAEDTATGDTAFNQTHFGLFVAPSSPIPHVYMVPRLSFDFAVIDGLTVGGTLGFVVSDFGTSTTNGGNTVDVDGPSATTFLLNPRVGYVLGLSHLLNLWLRGGVTYFNSATHRDQGTDRSDIVWGLALDLEPTLLVTPFEHVGFTASILIDLPMAGQASTERTVGAVTTTTKVDHSVRNFGLGLGMVVIF